MRLFYFLFPCVVRSCSAIAVQCLFLLRCQDSASPAFACSCYPVASSGFRFASIRLLALSCCVVRIPLRQLSPARAILLRRQDSANLSRIEQGKYFTGVDILSRIAFILDILGFKMQCRPTAGLKTGQLADQKLANCRIKNRPTAGLSKILLSL